MKERVKGHMEGLMGEKGKKKSCNQIVIKKNFLKEKKPFSAGAESWECDIWKQLRMRKVILAPTSMHYVNSF